MINLTELKEKKWNGKVYGNSIYLNNEKIELTKNDIDDYNDLLNQIINA